MKGRPVTYSRLRAESIADIVALVYQLDDVIGHPPAQQRWWFRGQRQALRSLVPGG